MYVVQVVLAQAGEIDPTHYFNAQDGSVFAVDHLTLVNYFTVILLPTDGQII
jgi:hypothetical protein